MENVSPKTATRPASDRQPMCDDDVLRLLMDQRGHSVSKMASHFGVTPTAIRNRLLRLMLSQSVTHELDDGPRRRGRPKHLYFITPRGAAALAEAADEGIA